MVLISFAGADGLAAAIAVRVWSTSSATRPKPVAFTLTPARTKSSTTGTPAAVMPR